MKTVKRIILCILCALMLISICSCDYIDELRETTAYKQKDGTVKYGDDVYIKCDVQLDYAYEMDIYETLNLCLEGEPILWPRLMKGLGRRWDYTHVNEQKTVISAYYDNCFYIRADVYHDISDELISFNKGNCVVRYDDYRFENGGKNFSKEDSQALLDVMKGTPVTLDSLQGYYYNDYGSFYKYSENGNFYQYTSRSLAECDGKYYLIEDKYGEAYLATGRAEEILKELLDVIKKYEAQSSLYR